MNIDNFLPLILNVGKAELHSDWNYEDVNSPFARIYYIVAGTASISIKDKLYELKEGNLYMIPPYVRHSNHCDGAFVHYYMHIIEEDIFNHGSIFDEFDFPVEVKAEDFDIHLFNRLIEMNPAMRLIDYVPDSYNTTTSTLNALLQNKKRNLNLRIESRGIVYQIFSRFLKTAITKNTPVDNRIQACVQYINSNLNQDLRIETLAEKSCMSRNHFIRKFKLEMGVTPIQYINNRKIEKAQYYLFVGDRNVKDIAYSLGFYEMSNFYRLFKQIAGITPQEYQKQIQRNC